jgi:hypothetical protein
MSDELASAVALSRLHNVHCSNLGRGTDYSEFSAVLLNLSRQVLGYST